MSVDKNQILTIRSFDSQSYEKHQTKTLLLQINRNRQCVWYRYFFAFLFFALGGHHFLLAQEEPPLPVKEFDNAEQAAIEKVVSIITSISPYRAQQPVAGELRVFGTPTMDAVGARWGEGLKRSHPELEMHLSSLKGKLILEELVAHPSGVAMLVHPLKPEEIEMLKQKGLSQPAQFSVGVQALGVFVHESNPMPMMNQQQFLKIFSSAEISESGELQIAEGSVDGEVCDWSKVTWGDVGLTEDWTDKKIHLVCRDEASGTQIFLRERLLGGLPPRKPKSRHKSSAEVLDIVANDPQAIAISNLRSRQAGVRALQLHDGEEAIACHDYSILTGQYPLIRNITLVIDDDKTNPKTALAREFVKYALSQEGQRETILAGFFLVESQLSNAQLHRLSDSANDKSVITNQE